MPLFGPPNLARLKENRDAEGLARCLTYRDALVRLEAAQALYEIRDQRGLAFLIDSLKHSDETIRGGAAEILGELRDPQAVPALRKALRDEQADVREAAADALESIGGSEAQAALRAFELHEPVEPHDLDPNWQSMQRLFKNRKPADETAPPVTAAPAASLLSWAPAGADEHYRRSARLLDQDRFDLALVECDLALELSPGWTLAYVLRGAILEALECERQAIWAYRLALELDPACREARQPLQELEHEYGAGVTRYDSLILDLSDTDWEIRRDAAIQMGYLGLGNAVPDVIRLLDDVKLEVRLAAVEALGLLEDPRAAYPLLGRCERAWPAEELDPSVEWRAEARSAWAERFAILRALGLLASAGSLAQALEIELCGLQRNAQDSGLSRAETGLTWEMGVYALSRSADLIDQVGRLAGESRGERPCSTGLAHLLALALERALAQRRAQFSAEQLRRLAHLSPHPNEEVERSLAQVRALASLL